MAVIEMSQLLGSTLVAEGGGGGGITGLLPFILMIAVIYFIVLRPMSKQEKDRKKRVDGLKKGDQVVLGGGILGRISNADDDKIAVVEIADRVKVRVLKKDIIDTQAAALKDDKDKAKAGDKDKEKDKDKAKVTAMDKAKDKDTAKDKAKDKGKGASRVMCPTTEEDVATAATPRESVSLDRNLNKRKRNRPALEDIWNGFDRNIESSSSVPPRAVP